MRKLFEDLYSIYRRNTFHARIIIMLLYLERFFYIKFPLKVLRKIIIQMIYHCEINPYSFADIECIKTLTLPHPFGIIIHKNTILGRNLRIFQYVTIGIRKSAEESSVINDNVYIGCKATILGNCIINENAKIGAHALILSDVGAGKTIIGLHK